MSGRCDHRLFILALSLLAFYLICSCGAGGGDSEEGARETPRITNVQIIRQSDPTNPVNPAIDQATHPIEVFVAENIMYSVHYTDSDMDVDLLHFTRYYPSGRTDPFLGEQIEIHQETPDDAYTPRDYGFFGSFLGSWRLVFRVEDRTGQLSDPFDLYLDVKQPPLPPQPDPPAERCPGTPPAIDNAILFRENDLTTPIQPTGGVIEVTVNEMLRWQVDFTDPEKDAYRIRFDRYYPPTAASPAISSRHDIRQLDPVSSYLHAEPGFFGDFPGEWQLEFQIEDQCLHRSEIFALRINVIRP